MDEIIPFIEALSNGIDLLAVAVFLWGGVKTLFYFLRIEFYKFRKEIAQETLNVLDVKMRISFGGYLLLGLQFMIASDVIHTIVSASYHDLIFLAGIVAIRTVISYFLNKEIEEFRKRYPLKTSSASNLQKGA